MERHKAEEEAKEPDHEKLDKVDGTPVGQPVGSAASFSQCLIHMRYCVSSVMAMDFQDLD